MYRDFKMRLRGAFFVGLFWCGLVCTPALGAPSDVPTGSLRRPPHYLFAVFPLSPAKGQLVAAAEATAKKAGFLLIHERLLEPPTQPVVSISLRPLDQPIQEAGLAARSTSLGPDHIAALMQQKQGIVFEFAAPESAILPTYRDALQVVSEVARSSTGLILDMETGEYHTARHFSALLDDWTEAQPNVPAHVKIEVYRDGELLRIVSLGMRKLGLPDVVFESAAPVYAPVAYDLIELTLQTLVERGAIDRPGQLDLAIDKLRSAAFLQRARLAIHKPAKGAGTVTLLIASRRSTDPENRLIEIAFPGPQGTIHERHIALLKGVFGGRILEARH